MCRELLETQQQSISSFVESVEKEISTNSGLAQSLLEQASSAASRSLQEVVEGLIAKDRENASKLPALEEIQNETVVNAEEQQCYIEKVQLRLPTPQIFAVESASEAENYCGARPKTTQRVIIRSPHVESVPASKTSQDQEIETHAALLRDEVFNIVPVPSTINMTQEKPWARNVDLNEEGKAYNSQRLPQVPDTLVARGGVSSVTIKEPVSSTPHMRLHPTTVDLSGVSSTETSAEKTEDELIRHYQPWVKGSKGEARQKLFILYQELIRKVHGGSQSAVSYRRI